jgi:multiple sugar transport system ATP-binding protein
MSNSVQLKNIEKVYPGGVKAVHDFSIDIEAGEFIVLVGPSGCGKSTLLRMISGLEEITSGDLYIEGKRVNDLAPADRNIAMVFQNYALYSHMSVYDNLGFSLILQHEDSDVIHEKVMQVADMVDLESTLNRKPGQLSGGQKQRVALGRSVSKDTPILLMDEPLSNLDAKLRTSTRKEITLLHRRLNNTIIYVTHDQVEAMTMADRIVILNNGLVQQIGTPDMVYRYPENLFVASFIGTPPMNIIKGEIVNGSFKSDFMNFNLTKNQIALLQDYEGKEIVIGVRPEHFSLNAESAVEAENSFEAVVSLSEFLGSETLLYVDVSILPLIIRLKEYPGLNPGDSVRVFLDVDKVHFFDAETEMRIK